MRIVVVGGVAGGMSCAARARRLDEQAEIIVLERGEYVSFANCGLPYHVGGEVPRSASLLVQTPKTLRESLDLDVRVRHDVIGLDAAGRTVTVRTPEGEERIAYDRLVLSPGAKAFVPPMPGIDSPRAHTLRTVDDAVALRAMVDQGARRAVVLGGGFIGLEAAESLAVRGLEVSVVELAPHILSPLEQESAAIIADELRRAGVHIHEGVAAERVEPGADHDVVVLADGTTIDADLIVLSVGVRPDTAVFEAAGVTCERGAIVTDEHGRTNLPDVWAVGDAVLSTDAVTGARRPVALAGPASRAGRAVADDILAPERARPIPTAVGTAIVRVGSQAAGMTGANRRALDAAGIAYHTIHLHPSSHVSWFPGAEEVHLIVHFAQDDGRILGAQAVGRDGADKRVDVLATAIRAGLGIADLIDLDLAYAPPFGAAKDPITMAGMMGENVLDGTLRLWYAQDLDRVLAEALVLDVRREDEWVTGHVPGALHIPHTELRGRLDEVRAAAAGRPVRVLCESGVRSYIAHRVLDQAGFDSASLSGGMITLRLVLGERADDLLVTGADAGERASQPVA
ncbi:FAD-dependent oxidoreductase [Pseudoclavibacter caeni]|jgi:NADPH-dependent 2,4-dienoyl-CoA reductase/sulfur reductase-like enzyme/rhodanese-related sulfurtransferase|uniref:Pyridine nucleotide-disulfide oxidoreductase n=1 Tax=Pseudoclavibacter caeni TaxID=908846 RepID=A0A7C8FXZ4_9MICO|nr:FAD-dependent oxidoreductase [Pseudoclavibacter caeni]KAB1633520.1 pyridine nucleotide-disulfide oxidoreductase [Pseudoclavibacter caeni]NYJ96480.1 NADPH-dependent 2,4-dienoyl-CoA reductase/sulfur reductase-like enzyme/rhodanese-related sulfurtransferase [Pseudoclavibacter caeni]